MVSSSDQSWTGTYFYISKNEGSDFYTNSLPAYPVASHNYYVADFNGDGRTDFLCTDGEETWWNGYQMYRSGTKNKWPMEKVADGFNKLTKISYKYLSEAGSPYTKGSGAVFPVFDSQGPLPVVSSVLTDNGLGTRNTINYTYQGLKIHRRGKGFLCYSKQTIADVAGNMSTENNYDYNTTYYFPTLTSTINKAGTSAMSTISNSWSYITTATVIGGPNVIMPYVHESVQNNNLTGHQVTGKFEYDLYGTLEEKEITYEKGASDVVFTTTNTITNDATNWLLGKITGIREEYEAPGETTIARTTSLTYSSDGILKPDLIKYLEGTSWYYYKDHNYNSNGNLVQLTESGTGGVGSRQTGYTYETNGIRLKTITDPLGHLTTNNYDTYGRLSSQVDFLNTTTSYTYDNLGQVTTETRPDGFVTTTVYTWGLTGGPSNSCYYVQQSGNDGSLSKAWCDKLAREIRSDVKGFDGSFVYTVNVYNNKGQLYQVSEPSTSTSPSQWNTYTYDTYGRADYIDRPSGRDTDYAYNNNRVTETTGGKARWKETDSQGLVTAANDAGGDIAYNYYPDGQVKTITAPGSVVTSMQYDPAGNQTRLADPSAGTINYTYDAFGQVKTMVNARSQTTTYDYYADGRLLTRDTPEGTTTYRYNSPKKQLINISLPGSVSRSYSYDNKGRVETITDTIPGSSPFLTTFTYDSYGRLSTRTHPSGIVETMNYNASGYLASISAGGATRWTITAMNARQQITAVTLGNGLNATFGFDDYGYPTSSKAVYNSVYKQDYRYSFNPVTGNLNSRQNYLRSLLESFTHDDLDRLTVVSGPQNLSTTYGLNGNISTKSDIGTTPFTYGEDAGPYALTGVTSSTLVIPVATQEASYTSFDQVSTIEEGDYDATFAYDSENQRAKMVVNQNGSPILTRWYAGSRYMKETAGSTTKEYTWIGGDAYSAPAVAVKEGSTTTWYYLLRDYLGNITHQVDASNNVVAEYNFDPWGRRRDKDTWSYTLDSEPALFAGRGFTGHEHLTWFNLVNMNGRLYDPLVGRFLSPDNYLQFTDYTQNFNRYSYCLNNPLIYIDPSGDFLWIFPNISWSKKGGFSLGISIGFGIPGVASVQVGVGYNFKSGEPYVYGGATFMFNTVYTSYSPSGGWNVGYTAGASLYSGFPVSTNVATVGVNYNINNGSFSGNLSAWDIDRSGWSFDPSISAMIYPEQTTNFVRGQGFRTNNYVLKRFTGAGDYKGALDYFGFKGTFLDEEGFSTFSPKHGIRYRKDSFESYELLYSSYVKELYHERRYNRNNRDWGNSGVSDIDRWPEEREGAIYQYKTKGLHGDKSDYLKIIRNTEDKINSYNMFGDYNPSYQYQPYIPRWWHFIYNIRRLW